MGGPLPVILADMHMVRTENDAVQAMNPPFHKWSVEDIQSKRNTFQQDTLFEALNDFLPNILFTIEVNPEKFLHIKLFLNNESVVITQVYWKEYKKSYIWGF